MIGVAATALATALGGYVWHEEHRPPLLEIYVFELKSGHSIFIRTPEDQRILIDGGGNGEIIRRLSNILPFYSRRIDVLIITKPDIKNTTGLVDVADRYSVTEAFIPGLTLEKLGLASSTDGSYDALLNVLSHTHVKIREVMAGDSIELGKNMKADVIFPVPAESFPYSKASVPQIVFKIIYGSTTILSIGDIATKAQNFLTSTSSKNIQNVGALITWGNMSAANTSEKFIASVSPDNIVYSRSPEKASLKAVSKVSSKKGSAAKKPKKEVTDPLMSVLEDGRFNLREHSTVKIASDGTSMRVEAD